MAMGIITGSLYENDRLKALGAHCVYGFKIRCILYSQKYWQSLNLTVLPKAECKKILAEFKFGGVLLSRTHDCDVRIG